MGNIISINNFIVADSEIIIMWNTVVDDGSKSFDWISIRQGAGANPEILESLKSDSNYFFLYLKKLGYEKKENKEAV